MNDERGRNASVDSDLANDPNYIAYKSQEELLRANSMGKWVAFTEGVLVFTEDDEEILMQKIRRGHFETPVMIHQIVAVEEVIQMRSPRAVE